VLLINIKARPSRWTSAQASMMRKPPDSRVSGQETQRKRWKRADWTGSVYGSSRTLGRTSGFWSRVEVVEYVGSLAGPESRYPPMCGCEYHRILNNLLTTWHVKYLGWSSIDVLASSPTTTVLQTSRSIYVCIIGLDGNILVESPSKSRHVNAEYLHS
jgi:hypothetical protein